ncbi:Riboflavin biosynthesis protein RibF [Chlamydiales bacterium SCGC AG-110-M15]|nr:Riboflavin biosynthesis protein RibF [Chlamydiales bacterium SCGC AG-110-M15]
MSTSKLYKGPMKVVKRIEDFPSQSSPIALTIGNFDGVHKGHLFVLKHLEQTAKKLNALTAVLTFSNHPSSILKAKEPVELICSLENKLRLFHTHKIDFAIAIPFDHSLSQSSAHDFIKSLRKHVPFSALVFGSDTAFGKNREGDKSTVRKLAHDEGFTVEYLDKVKIDEADISSSRIRELIKSGKFKAVSELLGRPYSIVEEIVAGEKVGKSIGYPTLNLHVSGLCTPPLGVYATWVLLDDKKYPAVANLGIAPTFGSKAEPVLEVHLIDERLDLYGKTVEVIFADFLRPEMKFDSVDDLKKQIAEDVEKARRVSS